jgi:hypothetical protein
MRCERSVSSDSVGVAIGFFDFEPEGFGSAHPRSTVSSAGAPFVVGVASTSSHCSTARQYLSSLQIGGLTLLPSIDKDDVTRGCSLSLSFPRA